MSTIIMKLNKKFICKLRDIIEKKKTNIFDLLNIFDILQIIKTNKYNIMENKYLHECMYDKILHIYNKYKTLAYFENNDLHLINNYKENEMLILNNNFLYVISENYIFVR